MYILIAVLALLIIFIMVFFVKKNKKQKPLTTLAGLAFGFILAGIIFGDNRLVGYSLIGIGVLFAIIDMVKKMRVNKK